PIFVEADSGPLVLRQEMIAAGEVAAIHMPIATEESLLGILTVSVRTGPHRLKPSPDLLNRLSGVAAQATTALQNGRLVDRITHQALHDQLTGLANRAQFAEALLRRLDAAFEDPFMLDGHALRLTASIGRAMFPDDAETADALLRHADASMFEAKRGFFNPR